jgi:putative CRISPR-associated protein (TIGR02619 family)
MIENDYVSPNCDVYLVHSDTPSGFFLGEILSFYLKGKDHVRVEAIKVDDLQDENPKLFRTKGLRNLVRGICKIVRERHRDACAINATGGYKAQIAIALLIGQAIGVPVYYMHEKFSEIISFPPMPVSLDFEVWMKASGMLFELSREDIAPFSRYEEGWEERFEPLVEKETADKVVYVCLSPTGQIFHETFRDRFSSSKDQILPPPAPASRKQAPSIKAREPHTQQYAAELMRFFQRVTNENGPVVCCECNYFNPDLSEPTRFKMTRGEIEGIYTNGTITAKFTIVTTAATEGQKAAVVALLNDWLENTNN